MPKSGLNIIGSGRVGTSLAKLWKQTGYFQVVEILNTSLESAKQAVRNIGEGKAIREYSSFSESQFWMIATPDSRISEAATCLAAAQKVRAGDIAFHCSGALDSEVLSPLAEQGALTASLHPIKSFPNILKDQNEFTGSHCGMEGSASPHLTDAIKSIGGIPLLISSEHKKLYHAASVMSCNYLTALTEVSTQLLKKSGIKESTSSQLLQPIMTETLSNIFRLGTKAALTGPIQRGDSSTVREQLNALRKHDTNQALIYKTLGKEAIKLTDHSQEIQQQLLVALTEQPASPDTGHK